MLSLIKIMRPIQWVKNILCFAGILFSGRFLQASSWPAASLLFVAFSLVASSVYILNDILDAPRDRLHTTKKFRPIASGQLSVMRAYGILIVLLAISTLIASLVSKIALLLLALYLGLNIAYSFKLKHIPILDVFIISLGFILRLLSGTIGLSIPPSEWIIICTFMLALFFGFVKRYCELIASSDLTRVVIAKYSSKALEKIISVTASCAILSYSIFVITKSNPLLLMTIVPVCYAIFHIMLDLSMKQTGENFSKELFINYHILISLILWLALYIFIMF